MKRRQYRQKSDGEASEKKFGPGRNKDIGFPFARGFRLLIDSWCLPVKIVCPSADCRNANARCGLCREYAGLVQERFRQNNGDNTCRRPNNFD